MRAQGAAAVDSLPQREQRASLCHPLSPEQAAVSERTVIMQDNEIFTDDHQTFRRTVRKFAESLAPHADRKSVV